jgi:uncharacterized protein YeeX (DUF496 family)
MAKHKPAKAEIEALEAQVISDQEKPVRDNERRVRIGGSFNNAVKKMADRPPISNKNVVAWVRKQKKDFG